MSPTPPTGTGGLPAEGIPLPVVRGRPSHPPVAPAAPEAHPKGAPASGPFQPLLLVFTCNWCSYRAADLAGTARLKYPPNVRLIRFMCAGRLDPAFVLKAFSEGADGVVVTGCWPADCHYRVQNVKALRRFLLLRRVITGLGIEPERLQLVYASAAEGQRLAAEFTRIVDEVRALGPLGWRHRPEPVAGEPSESPVERAEVTA
jgi:F420-non-reducing hydrogenase iron-sulfur subunit